MAWRNLAPAPAADALLITEDGTTRGLAGLPAAWDRRSRRTLRGGGDVVCRAKVAEMQGNRRLGVADDSESFQTKTAPSAQKSSASEVGKGCEPMPRITSNETRGSRVVNGEAAKVEEALDAARKAWQDEEDCSRRGSALLEIMLRLERHE